MSTADFPQKMCAKISKGGIDVGLCGVCSISFRSHSVAEIIKAAAAAGLDGVEWGSDVHVKPGDVQFARQVRRQMEDAGLRTFSYGTYFGIEELSLAHFQDYLDTARALGTDILRIWPPNGTRQEIPDENYCRFVGFARQTAALAREQGMTLCLERHPDLLTEHAADALQFLQDVGMDNLQMYWQPVQFADSQTNLESARQLAPFVRRVHVFHWQGSSRYPLAEGIAQWRQYAQALGAENLVYLLEFMPDDDIHSLPAQAQALRAVLE